MQLWWESLSLMERFFAIVAIPATVVLVIQLVLSLIGLGDHDSELDGPDADGLPDGVDLDGDGIPDGVDLDGDGIPDEIDTDGDGVADSAEHERGGSLHLFSLRGVVAGLAVYGWAALAVSRAGHPWLMALIVGLALGAAALVCVALVMKLFIGLQTDGTVDVHNAVGLSGETYLTIPANRSGAGKVNVVIQETMTECSAVTDEAQPIPTGARVTVVGLTKAQELIVMRG